MPQKRKSDAMEPLVLGTMDTNAKAPDDGERGSKKARVSGGSDLPADTSSKPKSWKDIKLEGEDEDGVPVYDDCAEIRRKIRILQKNPGWKVTHWLQEIGGINSNSFRRFMSATGRNDGASNGTYYAAYVYFEKVRIFEGKKKTAKRTENEIKHLDGFPLERPRMYFYAVGR